MLLSKNIQKRRAIYNRNSKNLKTIVDLATDRIVRQGHGCFIEGYGVAYINFKDCSRDPIGGLLGYSDIKGFWGPISDELQKPLVAKIRNVFGINISHGSEYMRLVDILQELQNAHDLAFDKFNKPKRDAWENMDIFKKKCEQIKKDFKL